MNEPSQPDAQQPAATGQNPEKEPVPAAGAPKVEPDAAARPHGDRPSASAAAGDSAEAPAGGEPSAEAAAGESSGEPGGENAGAGGAGAGDSEGRKRRRRRRRGKSGQPPAEDAGQPRPPHGHPRRHDAAAGGRQPRPQRERPRSHEHGALVAMRALSQMAQSLLKIEGVDPLSVPRYLELSLRVPLDDRADARAAAAGAVEQLLKRVREVREHEAALRPGSVFCYFSGSAEVEHCRPTEPRQVFEGYNSTGRPVFSDFVTMAIERKDPGIDQLLTGEDRILTHVTMGRVLRTQQLAEFGGESPVFKILGQVDAGLFRVLGAEQKCAFSFQLLRGTTLEGKPRLRLHAVGRVDLMDLADPGVVLILNRFQRHLDAESLRLQGKETNGGVDDEEFVLPLLQDLAQKLQGRARSTGRRTQHAMARSEQGQRPTPRAYPDAGEASDGDILWDTEKGTIVVLGPKGRVHVFSPQARHVTSVVMQGSAIDRRRQQSRWRLAEPDERGEFRINLRRLVASGEDTPAAEPETHFEV